MNRQVPLLLVCFGFCLRFLYATDGGKVKPQRKNKDCKIANIIYQTQSLNTLINVTFEIDEKQTPIFVQSESQCAYECHRNQRNCSSAYFNRTNKRCYFSAKSIDCQPSANTTSSTRIIHCIKCRVDKKSSSLSILKPRKSKLLKSRSKVSGTSRRKLIVSQTIRQKPPENTTTLAIKNKQKNVQTTIVNIPSSTSITIATTPNSHTSNNYFISTPSTNRPPTVTTTVKRKHSSIKSTKTEKQQLYSLILLNSKNGTIDQQFNDSTSLILPEKIGNYDDENDEEDGSPSGELTAVSTLNISSFDAFLLSQMRRCSVDIMKPCNRGFGRDCRMVYAEDSGCSVCICPHKSPARGCAGPQGLNPMNRYGMLMLHHPCPSGDMRMQVVSRWYRKVNKADDIDECVSVQQPYCGWAQDVIAWRMPRTHAECVYFCYSDNELIMINKRRK